MSVADGGAPLVGRAPTIRDVALRAGVSPQTVSRVVNNQPMVHSATRLAVLTAVGELRYRPNLAARSLVTRHSRSIGVVLPQSGHFSHSTALLSIDLAAQQAGYAVIIRHISTDAPALTKGQINMLFDLGVEGLVVVSPTEEIIEAVTDVSSSIPVTYLDPGLDPSSSAPSWQEQGSRIAVEHLVALGHSRIARVPRPLQSVDVAAGVRGFIAAMTAVELEPGLTEPGDGSPNSWFNIGFDVATQPDFTAVIVDGDHMAMGFIHALTEAGHRVPEDVSVVGFGNSPEAEHMRPALTTISCDLRSSGRDAVNRLLCPGEASKPTGTPVRLVVRQSTSTVALMR